MDKDDIVYLCLLIFSILIGHVYRKINDPNNKKWIGTGLGLFIIFTVSGVHGLHALFSTLVNAVIILFMNKRVCHLVSFVFSFAYLIFFRTSIYFGIPYAPAHTNLVQMMLTLKLVGLAFEVNSVYLNSQNAKKQLDNKYAISEEEQEARKVEPNFIDVFHYAFNYVGVLTGPYYKYRTFIDSIYLPFSTDDKVCQKATLEKLKWLPLYIILYLIVTYIWPLSYANSDEFYNERSWLYRLWYVTPTFFWFRMRIYSGLTLSECVCTMAGLGIYPVSTAPKPGEGPTKNFPVLKSLVEHPEKASEENYDFESIHNIHPYGADFCTTFREGMKHWNMCIQYWLAVNIYKRFPSRQFRTLATMFVSAVWHGVYIGYYFCILGVPFYLPLEDLYVKLFLKNATGFKKPMWEYIILIFKMQTFAYLGIAFQMLTVERVMKYYNSIYHCGLILAAILYLAGIYMTRLQKKKQKTERVGDDQRVKTD